MATNNGDSKAVFHLLRFPLASVLQCPFVSAMNWGRGTLWGQSELPMLL